MRNRQPRVGPVIVTGWIDVRMHSHCQCFPRSVLTMVEKKFLNMTCHCNFFESNKPQPTCSLQHVHCSPRSKLNIHKFSFFSFSLRKKKCWCLSNAVTCFETQTTISLQKIHDYYYFGVHKILTVAENLFFDPMPMNINLS